MSRIAMVTVAGTMDAALELRKVSRGISRSLQLMSQQLAPHPAQPAPTGRKGACRRILLHPESSAHSRLPGSSCRGHANVRTEKNAQRLEKLPPGSPKRKGGWVHPLPRWAGTSDLGVFEVPLGSQRPGAIPPI